jgi:hypothetical protein
MRTLMLSRLLLVFYLLTGVGQLSAATSFELSGSSGFSNKLVSKPRIVSFSQTGCVNKGQLLSVIGQNFGLHTGKGIALKGNAQHIDLTVQSWNSTSIVVLLPNDSGVGPGKTYSLAIENNKHSQWLGNTDKSLTFCAAKITLAPKPDLKAGSTIKPPWQNRLPKSGGEVSEGESGNAPSQPVFPTGGGSLLGRDLPPAPQQQEEMVVTKEPEQFESAEVVAVSRGMEEANALAQQLISSNITVKRRHIMKNLGLVISVLHIPRDYGVAPTVDALRNSYPDLWTDVNHRYQLYGTELKRKRYAQASIRWPVTATRCGSGARIGLIDTGVDLQHPALKEQRITLRSFLSAGINKAPAEHGTAIAGLLVGNPVNPEFAGLVPAAKLFAATVFRLRDEEQVETTAELIVKALDWLIGQKVEVINLSLGGPRNLIVELALQQVLDKKITVVAAAGHNGTNAPSGPKIYPAAQKGVLAITAIDANNKIYPKASQGSYIDFAAPGVDVWAASPGGTGAYRSGTSFAAPFLTGVIAQADLPATSLIKGLRKNALDLGESGKDPVFGWGLVRNTSRCSK